MDLLIAVAVETWNELAPTTWMLVLGLLISIHMLRKALF